MNIFLDDVRDAPKGWIKVRWPNEVIEYLKTGKVKTLSLDHDLGDDEKGTGYDIILWIEERVKLSEFNPPEIIIHSANSVGRQRMERGIEAIKRIVRERLDRK